MLRVSLFLGLLAVVASACNRDQSGAPGPDPNAQDRAGSAPYSERVMGSATITSAALTTKDSAVNRITAARCAREVACSNIGADKPFTSNDKCVTEVQAHLEKELSPNECPDGIDGAQVDACLEAIRNESCSNAITTMQRLAACRTSSLCLKTPGRPLL